jgi:dienelactone hydrolase
MRRTMLPILAAWLALGSAGAARAEIKTQEIEYKAGDTPLQGFLAWDDAQKGKRPGVLVVHEWWGHNQHARNQAIRLAKAGYVGFALDMYGKGKTTTHPEDAQKFVAEVMKDPPAAQARFNAALELLKKQPQVDPKKVAAIGYCFGGAVVLSMASAGADLAAVGSFHGAMPSVTPEKGKVKAKVLIQAGGADPMVPKEKVEAFEKSLKDAGADVKVVVYPGVKHSFTNPDADKAGMDGLSYNADADQKSWAELTAFLKKTFGT